MEKEKNKYLTITMPGRLFSQINEMATHYSETRASMIRRCISEYYNTTYRKQVYGYQTGFKAQESRAKRENKSERVQKIRDMNNEELTVYLVKIGYVEEFEEIGKDIYLSFKMYTRPDNTRFLSQEYRKTKDHNETPYSTGDAFSLDSLIRDLEKEKLL